MSEDVNLHSRCSAELLALPPTPEAPGTTVSRPDPLAQGASETYTLPSPWAKTMTSALPSPFTSPTNGTSVAARRHRLRPQHVRAHARAQRLHRVALRHRRRQEGEEVVLPVAVEVADPHLLRRAGSRTSRATSSTSSRCRPGPRTASRSTAPRTRRPAPSASPSRRSRCPPCRPRSRPPRAAARTSTPRRSRATRVGARERRRRRQRHVHLALLAREADEVVPAVAVHVAGAAARRSGRSRCCPAHTVSGAMPGAAARAPRRPGASSSPSQVAMSSLPSPS